MASSKDDYSAVKAAPIRDSSRRDKDGRLGRVAFSEFLTAVPGLLPVPPVFPKIKGMETPWANE